jgi:hypothetical protein
MKRHTIFLGSFIVLAAIVAGCGSSSSSDSTPSVFCSTSLGGTSTCYGYTNLTASEQSSVSSECTQSLQGSVVSACPTSGLAGCCKYSAGGITTDECYYQESGGVDPTTSGQQACTAVSGTWSTGM